MKIGENIRHYRKLAGLTLIELSTKCGWDGQSRLGNYERGEREPRLDDIRTIAAALGIQPSELLFADEMGISTEQNSDETPLPRRARLPVVASAQLGDNGNWVELDYPVGSGDGYILWQSRDANAYAVRCVGDSMSPRIRNGEYAIVEPNHSYQPGDEVLVRAKDGRVMVKVYLYNRDGKICLGSINDAHANIFIEIENIDKMHYVAGFAKNALWQPE